MMLRNCGFGHVYDADIYPSCPYCNSHTRAIVFGEDREGLKTEAVSDGQNITGTSDALTYCGKTTAPEGYGKSASGEDRTIAPTRMPESFRKRMECEQIDRTVGQFKQKLGFDPVVGWLVCIDGPQMGEDYRLYGRINTIGRSADNDVVLAQEHTVSHKNHARVAYDPKHNQFQVIPGEGSNVFYLNDDPVYAPKPLHAYDVLEFNQTKLMFVPFCSDHFQWPQNKAGRNP